VEAMIPIDSTHHKNNSTAVQMIFRLPSTMLISFMQDQQLLIVGVFPLHQSLLEIAIPQISLKEMLETKAFFQRFGIDTHFKVNRSVYFWENDCFEVHNIELMIRECFLGEVYSVKANARVISHPLYLSFISLKHVRVKQEMVH
jgi:hypothetical protein